MAKRLALVTGAMGFIGRHVVAALDAASYRVQGIGHGSGTAPAGLTHWLGADVTLEALTGLGEAPELIVHCAGSGSVAFAQSDPAGDFARSVETTQVVLEYARRCAEKPRVVLPSSAAVYGDADIFPTPENAPSQPVSPYGVHKRVAEQLCQSYACYFAVPATVVRLFSVYGPGLKKQLLWDACCKLSNGQHDFFGSGNEVRDWLHVADAAALLLRAADHAGADCPIFNGGCGIGVSNRAVLECLAQALGAKVSPRFSGTARPGDPLRYQADIGRARSLGWAPQIGWQQGVAEYAAWFRGGCT